MHDCRIAMHKDGDEISFSKKYAIQIAESPKQETLRRRQIHCKTLTYFLGCKNDGRGRSEVSRAFRGLCLFGGTRFVFNRLPLNGKNDFSFANGRLSAELRKVVSIVG